MANFKPFDVVRTKTGALAAPKRSTLAVVMAAPSQGSITIFLLGKKNVAKAMTVDESQLTIVGSLEELADAYTNAQTRQAGMRY